MTRTTNARWTLADDLRLRVVVAEAEPTATNDAFYRQIGRLLGRSGTAVLARMRAMGLAPKTHAAMVMPAAGAPDHEAT